MPFSALLDGEPVISLLMSDEQWTQAKSVSKQEEERLLVGFTKLPGFARTSSLGLRHFAHRAGYAPDYEWSESAEHLSLKAELVRAIAAHGWNVDTEVPSGPERNWIADVMAEGNGRRIAFEVQWSKQSAEEYIRRTDRYAVEGIECVWFVRHVPKLNHPDLTEETRQAYSKIAVFELQNTEHLSQLIAEKNPDYASAMLAAVPGVNKGISMGKQILPVGELAKHVLDERVQVRPTFSVIVYSASCWHCKQLAIYWRVEKATKRISFQRPEQDGLIVEGAKRAGLVLDPSLPYAVCEVVDGRNARGRLPEFSCPRCKSHQKPALENANLVSASRQGRGLRFDVPVSEKWAAFLDKWGVRTSTRAKLNLKQ